jgi:hypothetical protein
MGIVVEYKHPTEEEIEKIMSFDPSKTLAAM